MKRYRVLSIGALVIFTSAANAHQTKTDGNAAPKNAPASAAAQLPTLDSQLAVLTEKLDLSGDQQSKIKPILKELHETTEKILQDKSLSQEERLTKVRPFRRKADSEIRVFLSDEQKKKLDQYLQGPHPEMHGTLTGTAQPPQH